MKQSDIDRFWSKVDKDVIGSSCWFWTGGKFHYGHGRFKFEGNDVIASRLSWCLANDVDIKELKTSDFVCHICHVPECVRPSHLYLGSAQSNSDDRVSSGRNHAAHGELSATAKLSKDEINSIRDSYEKGNVTQQHLANVYGVSAGNILLIVRGKSWKSHEWGRQNYLHRISENNKVISDNDVREIRRLADIGVSRKDMQQNTAYLKYMLVE